MALELMGEKIKKRKYKKYNKIKTTIYKQVRISKNISNRGSESGYDLRFFIGRNIRKDLNWKYNPSNYEEVYIMWDKDDKSCKIFKSNNEKYKNAKKYNLLKTGNIPKEYNLVVIIPWKEGFPWPIKNNKNIQIPVSDLEWGNNKISFKFPASCFNYLNKESQIRLLRPPYQPIKDAYII